MLDIGIQVPYFTAGCNFQNNVKVFFHNLSAPKECFNCKECSCLYLYIRPSIHCETKDIFNGDFVIF